MDIQPTPIKPTDDSGRCQWQFLRGMLRGQYCNVPTEGGSIYCENCKRKKRALFTDTTSG